MLKLLSLCVLSFALLFQWPHCRARPLDLFSVLWNDFNGHLYVLVWPGILFSYPRAVVLFCSSGQWPCYYIVVVYPSQIINVRPIIIVFHNYFFSDDRFMVEIFTLTFSPPNSRS